MIEYNTEYARENLVYFSDDGSYGSADNLVIIDTTELDGHWSEVIEQGDVGESQRPAFMRWYVENQTHDQFESENSPCQVCDLWQRGTEDEILEELEEMENN